MQINNNYKENVRRKIPTTRHKNGHERKKKWKNRNKDTKMSAGIKTNQNYFRCRKTC